MIIAKQDNVIYVGFRKMTVDQAQDFLGIKKFQEAMVVRKKILLLWTILAETEDSKTSQSYAAIFADRFKKLPENHSAEIITINFRNGAA
jgi:hypothetical protein